MKNKKVKDILFRSKLPLNIAIVGGGSACKTFLETLQTTSFPYLDINIIGVCDINSNAEGFLMAKERGIYTTNDFHDFFKLKNLNNIVELTNSREVLIEIVKSLPKNVGVMEFNIGRIFHSYSLMDQELKYEKHKAAIEKMSFDFLIQQSDVAIVVINTDFTIAEANEAYLKIVNKPLENVLGGHCHEVYYGLKAPCSSLLPTLKCPMLETLKTGKTAHVIHKSPASTDVPTFVDIVTYPLKDINGEIFKIIEIWQDITEEISNQWERQAKDLKADLNRMIQEDRMISLGKLAASCVHEINNPIQGLLTFSDLMQKILSEGPPSTEDLSQFRHFLSLMSSELERCGNIVSGLLSFSRESHQEYKALNINDVLEAVISLTRHKMELQKIQLNMDYVPGIILVRGDANRLQQVLLNLIFNAIESMSEGGQLGIVTRLDKTEKKIQIIIQDTGYGIPKEHMDHIFDPFFTSKKEGEGTGLGLSIVYGVIKNHGGKIGIKSRVGSGSNFTVTLPTL